MTLNEQLKTNSLPVCNLTILNACPGGSAAGRRTAASAALMRLAKTAALLKEDGFFCVQVSFMPDKLPVCAFTDAETRASQEDFAWFFGQFASVSPAPQDDPAAMPDDSCRVYALQRVSDKSGALASDDGDSFSDDDFGADEIPESDLDELRSMGLVMRFLLTGKDDAPCAVLIYTKEELSLHRQTILSMTFPNTRAVALSEDSDPWLPLVRTSFMAQGVLQTLMREAYEEQKTEAEENGQAVSDDSEFDETPIEELKLSMRTYNCLKRALIDTVGELRSMTDEQLLTHVRGFNKRCVEDVRAKLSKLKETAGEQPDGSPTESLNALIGLADVKRQVRRITAFARMKRDMKERDKEPIPIVLNMEFTGNPGTAKTTVARILAGIFFELGLLKNGKPLEVGRADLVGAYQGQTARHVRDVFERAKGRLLFIDEAYSLLESHEGEYGDEAISTIVQEMENHREETVVIFAGYPNKMKEFFARNPGLSSRVPFHIRFPDYSPEEMAKIVELEARRRGFSLSEDAQKRVAAVCRSAECDVERGNGRFCRNLAEDAVLNFAERTYGDAETPETCEFVLSERDFPLPASKRAGKTGKIGFDREPA